MLKVLRSGLIACCLFLSCMLIPFAASSQEEEVKVLDSIIIRQFKMNIGSTLTFLWDNNDFYYPNKHIYTELTWNTNIAFTYFDRLWFGAQVMPVFGRQKIAGISNSNRYLMGGLFVQFDFFSDPKKKLKIYGETSINVGNYCTCGQGDPFRQDGLLYLGLGGGFKMPLKSWAKNWSAEAGFFNYITLNDLNGKYSMPQYVIGLNYSFGDREIARPNPKLKVKEPREKREKKTGEPEPEVVD